MPDKDMPDLTVRGLKTEMDGGFRELRLEMNSRFDRLEARITEGEAATRRHFDIVAESLRAEIRLRLEGTDSRVDDHERRIQALEKRRR